MRGRGSSELVRRRAAVGEGNDIAQLLGMSLRGRRAKLGTQLLSVGLIDPKALTRQSISETLAKALPEYVTIAVSSCEELLEMRGKPRSWVLIIIHTRSAQLRDLWVQNTLEFVRQHLAGTPVALLSDRDDVEEVLEALTCGVRGFISTSLEAELAIAAFRLIGAGGTFIPTDALHAATTKTDTESDYERPRSPEELELTLRELSVIDLICEGKPNKVIAGKLDLQESTVKVHVRNILRKLNAANRTQAALVANRLRGYQVEGNSARYHGPDTPKR
jgi:DNA-binding NarL/FixJ family response regulator